MERKIITIILVFVLAIVFLWITYLNDLYILEKNWLSQIKAAKFEKRLANRYPYGEDKFHIDHGENYFAFFERLGDLHYIAKIEPKGNIVGSVACILRKIKRWDPNNFHSPQKLTNVWYIGDLKLDPSYRNQRFPLKIFLRCGVPFWFKSNRVYAISMDSGSNPNRILKLAQKIPFGNFKNGGKLYIYSLNKTEIQNIHSILTLRFGSYHFVDLKGVKDLILESSGERMKIKHLVRDCYISPKSLESQECDSFTHMFCLHSSDSLIERLKGLGITTQTTATIIHRGMENTDWSFINTSEL